MKLQAAPPQPERLMNETLAILAALDDRITRIETMLFKLALHLGVQPRNGERLCDAD